MLTIEFKTLLAIAAIVVSATTTFATETKLAKICDKATSKKAKQFQANVGVVQNAVKKATTEKAKAALKLTELYEWARFASPESLGTLLNPLEKDTCVSDYQAFITLIEEKKSAEKLELWRACLNTSYREAIPQMAKDLLACHGANPKEVLSVEEAVKKPLDDQD